MKNGFTVLELAIVLTLLVLIAGVTAPSFLSVRDRLTVRAAREDFVGQVQRARSAAVNSGSALLEIRPDSALVRVMVHGRSRSVVDFRTRYGVELDLGGSTESARLRFGRLGLGRVASRTVKLFRRSDTVSVAVSSFGRLRRW